MPGTTGEEAVKGIFGRAPEEMVRHPIRRRYPFVAVKLPGVFVRVPKQIKAVAADTDSWWRSQVPRFNELSLPAAQALFATATKRFDRALMLQSIGLLSVVQPLYEALAAVVEKTGIGDVAILSGSGGAEMAIVDDMKASRGQLTLDAVVANHGFHGPREGEISARVWREDLFSGSSGWSARRGSGRIREPARARAAQRRGAGSDAARADRRRAALAASRGPPAAQARGRQDPMRGVAKPALSCSGSTSAGAPRVGQASTRRAGQARRPRGCLLPDDRGVGRNVARGRQGAGRAATGATR